MINFNIPPFTGKETEYMAKAIQNHKISGDGEFTKKCNKWIEDHTGTAKALLTTSCTHATEMAALLADIKPGDEVIMPSYTFVSTADAFVLRGATAVFVDIRPDTMNIDENLIEDAITEKTRAIVPVHYAGVACEMDTIMDIAKRHNLLVIEDAAQGVMSSYKGQALGSIGDYGCFSFHETKNYSMGEGGCLLIRDKENIDNAEIIREKGTNRSKFFRGQIDKYTWVEAGSSYLPSDMNAAYLYAQLEMADEIYDNRMHTWNTYYENLTSLKEAGHIELPFIPVYDRSVSDRTRADPANKTTLRPEITALIFLHAAEHMTILQNPIRHGLVTVLAPIVSAKIERRAKRRKLRKRNVSHTDLCLGDPCQGATRTKYLLELAVF